VSAEAVRRRLAAWSAAVLLFAPLAASAAEDLPRWELGVGLGGLSFPVYRGSDQRRDFLLPVPYFVYRGDILKADRRGVRGELIDSDRFELNISGSASLPVGSGAIDARRGMPDLKATIGLGPSVDVNLWESADGRRKLTFQLPVRAAFTLESASEFTGWQISPRVNLDIEHPAGFDGWRMGLLAGPIYGSKHEHEYFYSVAPQFATPERPAYDAAGGYAGTQLLMSLSKRFPNYWVGGFVRYDTLKEAAFVDSPLVRRDSYLAAGFGISWVIGVSSQRVKAED
jgi:outer membrane scaffolding protein for murein synthesis (MipA/OmpV family)